MMLQYFNFFKDCYKVAHLCNKESRQRLRLSNNDTNKDTTFILRTVSINKMFFQNVSSQLILLLALHLASRKYSNSKKTP